MSYATSFPPPWVPVASSISPPPELDERAKELIGKAKEIFPKKVLPPSLQNSIRVPPTKLRKVSDSFTAFEKKVEKQPGEAFPSFMRLEEAYKELNLSLEELPTEEGPPLLAQIMAFPPLLTAAHGALEQINASFTDKLKLHPETVTHLDLSAVSNELTDKKLSDLLLQFPNVIHLVLDGAVHLTENSFPTILKCKNLVELSLKSCSGLLSWKTAPTASLPYLRTLNVSYLSRIGGPLTQWIEGLKSLKRLDVSCSAAWEKAFDRLVEREILVEGRTQI